MITSDNMVVTSSGHNVTQHGIKQISNNNPVHSCTLSLFNVYSEQIPDELIEVTGRNYAMAMLLCTHRTYSIYHTVFSSYDDMLCCCLGQIVCYVREYGMGVR